MTLHEILELNRRISILPAQLTAEIRKLDVETVREIVEDPKQQLMYCKLDLFLKAIRESGEIEFEELPDPVDTILNMKKIDPQPQKIADMSRFKYSARFKRSIKAYSNLYR